MLVDDTCEIEVTSSSETVRGSRHLRTSFNTPAKVKYLNILHVQVGVCVWLGNKALQLI